MNMNSAQKARRPVIDRTAQDSTKANRYTRNSASASDSPFDEPMNQRNCWNDVLAHAKPIVDASEIGKTLRQLFYKFGGRSDAGEYLHQLQNALKIQRGGASRWNIPEVVGSHTLDCPSDRV